MEKRYPIIRPGMFGIVTKVDERRIEFDAHNEVLIYHQVPIDFLFIGDSITHMWDLQTYFGRTGQFVVNRGIGGDRSYYLLRRFSADALQLRPKHVVILIGINNTWALDEWVPSHRTPPEEIEEKITADVIELIRLSRNNGIVPILCSILPTAMDANANTAIRNELVSRVNWEFQQFASREKIIYVDYHNSFTEKDGITLNKQMAFDGLHPNVYGYNLMAEILRYTLHEHNILIT